MYQAIVFLPLLGAILAGLIAILGARGRFPGEAPPLGAEDEGTGAAQAHVHHHAPHGAGGGVIHHDSHEPGDGHGHDDHGHDDHGHGPVEPAASGSRTAELITTTLLMVSAILSWIALVQVGFGGHDIRVPLIEWIVSGNL